MSNIGFCLFKGIYLDLRSDIEDLIRKITQEQTNLKTELDRVQKLYESDPRTPATPPKPKRRKKDVRHRRKYFRQWIAKQRLTEKGDKWRQQEGTIRGQFHRARRAAKGRGDIWEISLAEWTEMWMSCPMIDDGFNHKIPAYQARGKLKGDVRLKRKDTTKGFEINNLEIWKGKNKLWPM